MNREEILPWVTHSKAFVFSGAIEQIDLAMIVTNNEASIIKPGMACVIVRVVLFCLSLVDENRLNFHSCSVKFDVPVELNARDNDN